MARRKPESKELVEHRLACEALDEVDFADLLAGLEALDAERASRANRASIATRIMSAVEPLPNALAGMFDFRQAIARVGEIGGDLDEARAALLVVMSASGGWSAAQAAKGRQSARSAKGGAAPKKLGDEAKARLRAFYARSRGEHIAAGKARGWVKATAGEFGVSTETVREVMNGD